MGDYAAEYARFHAGPDVDDEHTCCGKCSPEEAPAQEMDGRAWQPCEACQECEACNLQACAEHAAERATR